MHNIDSKYVLRKVVELKPYSQNARTHSPKQVRKIAKSIENFGFTNPVLIDEHSMILAGHGRVAAAQLLKMETVPCILISTMSEAEKRAYILADNKLALDAGWDEDILKIELQFILNDMPSLDLSLTGFEIFEVDQILDVGGAGNAADSADDDLPNMVTKQPPITRPGDVWCLGRHRLICGDARQEVVYDSLMRDLDGVSECAQMVFTDPPYNVSICKHVSLAKTLERREFDFASGEMTKTEFSEFLRSTFSLVAKYSSDGSIHFICMDWRHIQEVLAAGNAVYDELKNLVVWAKDNGGMGVFYRSRHELVFVFKKGKTEHINSFQLGQNGRYRTNVWNYRGASSSTKETREELEMHPTVKPVAMVADAMRDCSRRGGIVLDSFCGSGTVFIAAEKTGRRARAIEVDPAYCDVALVRWQTYAKDDAILQATGQNFNEVKNLRALKPQLEGRLDER